MISAQKGEVGFLLSLQGEHSKEKLKPYPHGPQALLHPYPPSEKRMDFIILLIYPIAAPSLGHQDKLVSVKIIDISYM